MSTRITTQEIESVRRFPLSPHTIRAIAVAAGADPKTVASVLNGAPARSTTAYRVMQAWREVVVDGEPTLPGDRGLAAHAGVHFGEGPR